MLLRPSCTRPFFARSCLTAASMPLRARITNSAFKAQSQAQMLKEQPSDEPEDVLFSSSYGVRTIELNRPKKLNSLNGSMIRKMVPRLQEWAKSGMANVIILKGAGPKALCAGGDVAALAIWNQEGPEGQQRSKDYFGLEYMLDHYIATYSKPYVAFMDGITMGGGVGLSVHAPFRIATERTVFAMPETTIGFFPDVGASFFLSRLDGSLGKYLALTSDRIKGPSVFFHGLATHYIDSSSLPDLENRLAELTFKDHATLQERYTIINSTIEEFVTSLPHDQPFQIVGEVRIAVDECFAFDDITKILNALQQRQKSSNNEVAKWATETSNTIRERSPTSVKVSLKALQLGSTWSIEHAIQREYHIAGAFMEHHDFVEGVSARLIKKPAQQPKWQPATLAEVDWEAVNAFFLPPEGAPDLELLTTGADRSYNKYPHAWTSLPTEEDVKNVVDSGVDSAGKVITHFLKQKSGKMGVKEKVSEILARKTNTQRGRLAWDTDVEETAAGTQTQGSQEPSS